MSTKTYDTKSYELARHFAADLDGISEGQIRDLAYEIQAAVEDWIAVNYSDQSRHQVDVQ